MPFALLRALLGAVGSSFVSGVAWSFGAGVAEVFITRYSKGFGKMLGKIDLLFHPSVTRLAVFSSALLNLAGLCTALGAATGALHGVFKDNATAISGTLIIVGIVCTQIAGWGRSPITAVDNNQKPQ